MRVEASVAGWIEGVRQGDSAATEALWKHCFPKLVQYAREKLRGIPRRAADEEDVALSAMESFFRAIRDGRFPVLADHNELLRLLLWMTARKAADLVRRETSQRRGRGKVRGDSALREIVLGSVSRANVPPELAMVLAEEVQRLMELLEDPDLQAIAVAKMEGSSNQEIAAQMQCSPRTVERRLQLIRKIWEKGVLPATSP
jgi:DNA-directed RNA polymerase specialized sigma24 family protein